MGRRKGMQIGKSRVLALLAIASIVASACSSTSTTPTAAPTSGPTAAPTTAPAATPAPSATAAPVDVYPRAQTLYTTGKQWGAPSTWNPLDPNAAMGVVGLQYETLFLYDTFKDTYTPWLALSGSWDDAKTTYTIKTRTGVKWSDGQDFSAADVAFTIGLAKIKALGSNLWTMVTDATATDATTVVVKFSKRLLTRNGSSGFTTAPSCPSTSGARRLTRTSSRSPTKTALARARTSTRPTRTTAWSGRRTRTGGRPRLSI
jgi:ABC-type transport system substrate-binding protein